MLRFIIRHENIAEVIIANSNKPAISYQTIDLYVPQLEKILTSCKGSHYYLTQLEGVEILDNTKIDKKSE